ncbi:MAG: hypothetical protein R2799_07635 [Crocinitomicaceae bacterium]
MKKIVAIVLLGGFVFTSCGHSICDAYSYNYKKKDIQNTKTTFEKVLNEASAEA